MFIQLMNHHVTLTSLADNHVNNWLSIQSWCVLPNHQPEGWNCRQQSNEEFEIIHD